MRTVKINKSDPKTKTLLSLLSASRYSVETLPELRPQKRRYGKLSTKSYNLLMIY